MSEDKKIFIDEDWKSQVQAEKDAAANKTASKPTAESPATTDAASGSTDNDPQMPPASFEMLVTSLATEALIAMGQVAHPVTGKAELQRNQAQYLIDTLDVLRQKTKGNLTPQEQDLIESVLHQVRMVFIAVANQAGAP